MTQLLVPLLWAVSPGWAQQPPTDPPALAIPVNGAGSPSAPAMTPEHLSALRKYREQRLNLQSETTLRGGGASVLGGVVVGGYRGGPYGGFGWSLPGLLVSEPPETVRGWGVYQGPQRLSVPELLSATGEAQRAKDLETEIHRANTASKAWMGVAGVGLAGIAAGVVGMVTAPTDVAAAHWSEVAMAGSGLAIGGTLVGSFPAGKAARLTHEIPETLTLPETQALVEKHNEALRSELGLSPEEAWQMETGPTR